MWLSNFLFWTSVIFSCAALDLNDQCSDCKKLHECSAAKTYIENTADEKVLRKKMTKSLCGTWLKTGYNQVMVCCSNFLNKELEYRYPKENDSCSSIEKHQNAALLPENCGITEGNRVTGGSVAKILEFPWMVLIYGPSYQNSGRLFSCAGTMINSRYVLTAAHCVYKHKPNKVRIGEYDITRHTDCEGYGNFVYCRNKTEDIFIEEIIKHKNYNRIDKKHDIALLRLEISIDLTKNNYAAICLPLLDKNRNMALIGKSATIAGWGLTEDNIYPSSLMKAIIPIVATSKCSDLDSENEKGLFWQLCAGELNKDSCKGDSGGPLMIAEEVNDIVKTIQYGIVSYGDSKCGTAEPGIYVNVALYMKWILDNIKP